MSRLGVWVAGAACCLSLQAPLAHAVTFDAYAWPTSVQQGDTVSIYISSSQPSISVQIVRYGAAEVPYAFYSPVAVGLQAVPDSSYLKGCDWTPALRIAIPDSWPSGVYAARILPADSPRFAPFVVRQKQPGSTSRILYMLSLSTMHAYNFWGGKSLYPFNSSNGVPSPAVSMRRPFAAEFGLSNFPDWAQKFIQFVESHGYTMEYCTGPDVDKMPGLLQKYGVVISAGHDEYWSRPQRNSVAAHVARGGSALFFGGNTCWWQARYEGDDRIVCYKTAAPDPLRGVIDSLVTTNWFDTPLLLPENSLTGESYRNGGYANFSGWYLAANGYGGFVTYYTNHWAFAGTQLSDGDTLGRQAALVGYETDGALFNWVDGRPVATGADGTPLNFVILGVAPASRGMATMGVYETPGFVFNAGVIDWSTALVTDLNVQKITLNVVNHALSSTEYLGVPQSSPRSPTLAVHVHPNPTRGAVSIQWTGGRSRAGAGVSIFDVHGALWSRPAVQMSADGASATWDTRDREGRLAPPGLYFAKVEGGDPSTSSRFLIVR